MGMEKDLDRHALTLVESVRMISTTQNLIDHDGAGILLGNYTLRMFSGNEADEKQTGCNTRVD